jgi:hypothetical protein
LAFSYVEYTGDGSTVLYTVPFPYLDRTHVTATVDGVSATFTWTTSTSITLTNTPALDSRIKIQRKTSQSSRVVDYSVPSSLDETTLDNDSLQAFYMAQEALDEARDALATPTSTSAYWDAESKQIKNVADPTADQDAATKNYVDDEIADRIVTAGSGNVVGPPSSTDAKIAGFDGTTGRLLQELTAAEARLAAGIPAVMDPVVTAASIAAARLALGLTRPMIDRVRSVVSTHSTATTGIPVDSSVPTQSGPAEGTELITATITPKASTSRLRVIVNGFFSNNTANTNLVMALFRDSTAAAIKTTIQATTVAGELYQVTLDHEFEAGNTLPTTLKIRVGPSSAAGGTISWNGPAGAQLFGSTSTVTMEVQEFIA